MLGIPISGLVLLATLLVCVHPAAVQRDSDPYSDGEDWPLTRGDRMTNAERLARGLTPNPPKRLYDPSKTHAAPAKRSVSPTIYVPVAATYVDTGSFAGYPYSVVGNNYLGLTQSAAAADTFSPRGEGNGQYVAFKDHGTNYWLWLFQQGGSINNPSTFIALISGQTTQVTYTNAWNTPTGFPGPLIADTTQWGGGPLKFYFQPENADDGVGEGGMIWIAGSAATINDALSYDAVSESDQIHLDFLSP